MLWKPFQKAGRLMLQQQAPFNQSSQLVVKLQKTTQLQNISEIWKLLDLMKPCKNFRKREGWKLRE